MSSSQSNSPKTIKLCALSAFVLGFIFLFIMPIIKVSVMNGMVEFDIKITDLTSKSLDNINASFDTSKSISGPNNADGLDSKAQSFIDNCKTLFIFIIINLVVTPIMFIIGLFKKRIGVFMPGLLFLLSLITLFLGASEPNIFSISAGSVFVVNMLMYLGVTALCFFSKKSHDEIPEIA